MASIEDLEEDAKDKTLTAEVDEFDEGIEDLMRADMEDALSWLNKCLHLLNYISDKDLCKTISKRERDSMAWLSEAIREFLDDVETHYKDEEEEV